MDCIATLGTAEAAQVYDHVTAVTGKPRPACVSAARSHLVSLCRYRILECIRTEYGTYYQPPGHQFSPSYVPIPNLRHRVMEYVSRQDWGAIILVDDVAVTLCADRELCRQYLNQCPSLCHKYGTSWYCKLEVHL